MYEQHFKTLNFLFLRLESSGIPWVLTGSFRLYLGGVNVVPHDIDIQTDQPGAYAIEDLFKDYIYEKVSWKPSSKIRSHYGKLKIHGVIVDIIGDMQKLLDDGRWEDPMDFSSHQEVLHIDGMEIPVLSLAFEHMAYLKLGRIEKAAQILKVLLA